MLDLLSNRLILTWHIGETLLHKSHPQRVVQNGIRIRSRKVQNFGHCNNSALTKPLKIDNMSSKIAKVSTIFNLPFLMQILAFGGREFAQIDLCKSANSQRAFSIRGPYCPSPPQGRAPPCLHSDISSQTLRLLRRSPVGQGLPLHIVIKPPHSPDFCLTSFTWILLLHVKYWHVLPKAYWYWYVLLKDLFGNRTYL